MQAALTVFAEYGYDGTTMQMIADKAKVNKALLHYYYRSKDKLYEIVFEKVFITSLELLNISLDSAQTIEEVIQRFINGYFRVLEENQQLALFVTRELSARRKQFTSMFKSVFGKLRQRKTLRILTLLEEARADRQLSDIDPIMLIQVIIGTAIHFFMAEPILTELADLRQQKMTDNAFLDLRKQTLFEIVWYGVKPRKNR